MTEAAFFPHGSVLERAGIMVRNVFGQKEGGAYLAEKTSFCALAGLMTGIDLSNLPDNKRTFFESSFEFLMYSNFCLDQVVQRAGEESGAQGLKRQEAFWIGKSLAEMMKAGLEAGYRPEVLNSIGEWFSLNRVINLCSLAISRDEDLLSAPFWTTFDNNGPEKEMAERVRSVFRECPKDKISQSIIFRALSSAEFAKTLSTLALDKKLEATDIDDRTLVTRTTAMTMAAQAVDDLGTLAKDVEFEHAGIAVSVVSGKWREGGLDISPKESLAAIYLSRQVLGACLKLMRISSNFKEDIARLGLVALGITVPIMMREYGGSRYPVVPTAKAVWEELRLSLGKKNSEGEYGQLTQKAVNLAIEAVLK